MYTKTVAVGRLVRDPQPKTYGSDGQMSVFSIAVDTGRDETQFYDCVAFGKTAENINKFFTKGRSILVEGIFQNNNQERTTQDGEKYTNYGMSFLVRQFSFLPDGQGQGGQSGQGGQQGQQQNRGNQQQGGVGQQQQQQGGFQNNFSGQQDSNPFAGQQDTNPFAGFSDDGVPF